jgi:hypothetical protein
MTAGLVPGNAFDRGMARSWLKGTQLVRCGKSGRVEDGRGA